MSEDHHKAILEHLVDHCWRQHRWFYLTVKPRIYCYDTAYGYDPKLYQMMIHLVGCRLFVNAHHDRLVILGDRHVKASLDKNYLSHSRVVVMSIVSPDFDVEFSQLIGSIARRCRSGPWVVHYCKLLWWKVVGPFYYRPKDDS